MDSVSTVFGILALLAALGITITLLLTQLRLPVVAGLLLAGAIAGPHGLGVVSNLHQIEVLAEVGVVLLLFTIGLEFSLSRLRVIAKAVLLGGSLQVGLTMGGGIGLALIFGLLFSIPVQSIAGNFLQRFSFSGDKRAEIAWAWISAVMTTLVFFISVLYVASGTYNPFIYFRF